MKYLAVAILLGLVLVVGVSFPSCGRNARVMRELRENPNSEQARKVMLLTLPSGKTIPVNYLRDGETVYAGADFPWWRELRGDGGEVTVLIQGETRSGHGRAVEHDPELRASVFQRLRPTAPRWAGTMVEIALQAPDASLPAEGPKAPR